MRAIAAALLLLVSCTPPPPAPPAAGEAGGTSVSGALALTLPGAAPRSFAAQACQSGEREAFFGVDLRTAGDDTLVRLVQDPLGAQTVRVSSGGKTWLLHREDCRQFDMTVRRTRDRVNSIWDMEGTLAVDCAAGEAAVKGEVRFAGCH